MPTVVPNPAVEEVQQQPVEVQQALRGLEQQAAHLAMFQELQVESLEALAEWLED
jgi:hypothetical protein